MLVSILVSILAVTELTVASYEEDKFGVVQKTSANILTTLLMLQDVSLSSKGLFELLDNFNNPHGGIQNTMQ